MNVCGVSLLAAFPRRRTLNLTRMSWVAEGFERFDGGADFMELVGPVYARGEGSERVLGLSVEDRHRNAGGVAHGGLLATLVDFALGRAIEADADDDQQCLSESLSTDYLSAIEPGS